MSECDHLSATIRRSWAKVLRSRDANEKRRARSRSGRHKRSSWRTTHRTSCWNSFHARTASRGSASSTVTASVRYSCLQSGHIGRRALHECRHRKRRWCAATRTRSKRHASKWSGLSTRSATAVARCRRNSASTTRHSWAWSRASLAWTQRAERRSAIRRLNASRSTTQDRTRSTRAWRRSRDRSRRNARAKRRLKRALSKSKAHWNSSSLALTRRSRRRYASWRNQVPVVTQNYFRNCSGSRKNHHSSRNAYGSSRRVGTRSNH